MHCGAAVEDVVVVDVMRDEVVVRDVANEVVDTVEVDGEKVVVVPVGPTVTTIQIVANVM